MTMFCNYLRWLALSFMKPGRSDSNNRKVGISSGLGTGSSVIPGSRRLGGAILGRVIMAKEVTALTESMIRKRYTNKA